MRSMCLPNDNTPLMRCTRSNALHFSCKSCITLIFFTTTTWAFSMNIVDSILWLDKNGHIALCCFERKARIKIENYKSKVMRDDDFSITLCTNTNFLSTELCWFVLALRAFYLNFNAHLKSICRRIGLHCSVLECHSQYIKFLTRLNDPINTLCDCFAYQKCIQSNSIQ